MDRLAAPAGGQAADTQRHAGVGHGGLHGACKRFGCGGPGCFKTGPVQCGGATQRQAQRKFSLLRNTFLAAHQPAGGDTHFQVLRQAAGAEVGCNGQWHRQKHCALKAQVGQAANGNLVGRGPSDVARHYAGRQGPGQCGGQAGVAGILPVGVPLRLVLQLQTQPYLGTRRHALRGISQQLSAYLLGLHHCTDGSRFGIKLGSGARRYCASSYKKESNLGAPESGARDSERKQGHWGVGAAASPIVPGGFTEAGLWR